MLAMFKSRQPTRQLALSGAERRLFPRKETNGVVAGRRLDHALHVRQNPNLTLTLRDVSLGGLSAITEQPLGKGERLAVTFPPQGFNGGWSARGRVIRCDAGAFGYRIAVAFDIEFDPMPLAA